MKLLVIGNSLKLIRFVESIFPVTEKQVVSWRALPMGGDEERRIAETQWDILLVAGYDYTTASRSLKVCLEKNVKYIIEFATACVSKKAHVIYANTLAPVKPITYSRYLYAKMRLGVELAGAFSKADILGFPTIIEHGAFSTTGGPFTTLTFYLLDCLGFLSKVSINQSPELNKRLFNELKAKPLLPKPMLLSVPRPLILDRLLRLLLG